MVCILHVHLNSDANISLETLDLCLYSIKHTIETYIHIPQLF